MGMGGQPGQVGADSDWVLGDYFSWDLSSKKKPATWETKQGFSPSRGASWRSGLRMLQEQEGISLTWLSLRAWIKVSWSVRAVTTKLINNRHSFLRALEPGSPRSWRCQIPCLVWMYLLHGECFFAASEEGVRGPSGVSSIRALVPFWGAPPSSPPRGTTL